MGKIRAFFLQDPMLFCKSGNNMGQFRNGYPMLSLRWSNNMGYFAKIAVLKTHVIFEIVK